MVQGIENLTALVVRVFEVSPHPSLGDWDQWDVEIVTATPIEGVADLLSQRVGERLPIAVPRQQRLTSRPVRSWPAGQG